MADIMASLLAQILRDSYDPSQPSKFGPLGTMFEMQPGGPVATELSTTVESPTSPGKFINIPLLVPGQIKLEDLLLGKKMTAEQVRHAISWAVQSGLQFPEFNSIDEAITAAKERSMNKGRLQE